MPLISFKLKQKINVCSSDFTPLQKQGKQMFLLVIHKYSLTRLFILAKILNNLYDHSETALNRLQSNRLPQNNKLE